MILYTNHNIRVQNLDHGPSLDLSGATLGIENVDGTRGLQYHLNGAGGVLFSSPLAIEFGTEETDVPVELEGFVIE